MQQQISIPSYTNGRRTTSQTERRFLSVPYSCLFAFIFERKVRFGRSRNSSLQLKTRKEKTERGRTKSRQRVDDLSRDRFIRPLELIFENEKRTVCHR
jgi:hypothetical protein